jgi:hypothetical protein
MFVLLNIHRDVKEIWIGKDLENVVADFSVTELDCQRNVYV